ncbi:MAG: uridine kinase [Bacteroidetes bacterium GWA2_31_9b]|nr:MAG: uridine kinase [Bacteroidetes bacterium GWA2_31_9b]
MSFIIGIAGGTGSGKTTVVKKIIELLPKDEVAIIPQDSYYRDNSNLPLEERQDMNFDHPRSLEFSLLIEHIKQLKSGNSIEQPIYSYLTCTRSKETIKVEPKKVVIVEGILILANAQLRNLMDIKVFVDADNDDRLMRVIMRDIVERGRSVNKVLERYVKTVKPMHLQFIEPTKRYADIIIPQGGDNKVGIDILASIVEKKLHIDIKK